MNQNISILINSCDTYTDVLELNLCAFNEYWPNCDWPIYINTETIHHYSKTHNVKSINCNSNNWGRRLMKCLSEIKTEFVLVIYDDFILEKKVNQEHLDIIIKKMSSHEFIACYYLKHTDFELSYNPTYDLYFVNNTNYYLVNSGPGIWRKDVLLSLLDEKDDPWAWEFFAMYKEEAKNLVFCSVPPVDNNIYEFNHQKGGAIYRGKWVEEVVASKIKKYGLKINLDKRGKISFNELKPRSIYWKINFIISGFRMVGFKALNLFVYILKLKLKY